MMRISLNGHWIKKIQLTGQEPEFNFGYGVFETIRSYYGQPFALPAHLRRLRQSARALQLRIAPTNTELTRWIKQHCQTQIDQRLKLIAAPDRIYILSQPLIISPALYHQGIAVCTYPSDRIDPMVKSLARIHEYMANSYATTRGYHDALLLDKQQRIWEGAYSNVFMIKRGVITTPDKNILFGVTRGRVLQLARRHYQIKFRPLTRSQLTQADECFLTQTSVGIAPIIRVNRQTIASGKVGPVTQDLINRFTQYVTTHYSTRRHS